MPGVNNGKVIRRSRVKKEMPWTRALSSSVGSMARNDAAIMMKASGTSAMPSTQPMPTRLTTLKGACSMGRSCISALLAMPMRGWNRITQPMAVKKLGTSRVTVRSGNTSPLPGSVVRSANQAQGIANANATTSATPANTAVLRNALAVKGSV